MASKDIPTLIIDGREITPDRARMRAWRKLLQEPDMDADMAERMDYYLKMIVEVFGRDEVTLDVLDEIMYVEDVLPLYSQCVQYVFRSVTARLDKLPNAQAPTEAQT